MRSLLSIGRAVNSEPDLCLKRDRLLNTLRIRELPGRILRRS